MGFQFLVHGEIHYLSTTIVAQLNEHGEFISHFGTVQDVTAFKLGELALIKSEEEKATAMQIAKLGSWEIDVNDGLKYMIPLASVIIRVVVYSATRFSSGLQPCYLMLLGLNIVNL